MFPSQQSRPTSDLQKRSMQPVVIQSHDVEDGLTLKPANGRRHPAVTLTALTYADDVAITSDSANGPERIFHLL